MGRVALITGASKGIGSAAARRLATEGFDIVVNYYHSQGGAEDTARQVRAEGRKALIVRADVASADQVQSMVSQALETFPGVHVLVNNAGRYRRTTLEDLSLEEWNRTLAVNLTGAYNCMTALVPSMRASGWGRIINISSQLATKGTDHGADYVASKAGLLGLTKAAALELAKYNITVNAISPGTIDTDIIAHYTQQDLRRKAEGIPLGRIGRPEDVASVISFLASDDSDYMTGATIHVNGGGLIV